MPNATADTALRKSRLASPCRSLSRCSAHPFRPPPRPPASQNTYLVIVEAREVPPTADIARFGRFPDGQRASKGTPFSGPGEDVREGDQTPPRMKCTLSCSKKWFRGDPSTFEYDRITRNKVFRFYSMFIKWYSVVIKCLFNVYSMVFDEKKIIEYPRFSQYSAVFNVIRA